MLVRCPSCSVEYEIPELQRPRKLRCAQCGAEWREAPPEPRVVPLPDAVQVDGPNQAPPDAPAGWPDAEPAPPPPLGERLPMRAETKRRAWFAGRDGTMWAVLWVSSLALIGAGLFGLWHWRGPIGQAWPPSQRLYRLLRAG